MNAIIEGLARAAVARSGLSEAHPDWREPDMSLARPHVAPAPAFPDHVFPAPWRPWIAAAAEGASSPPDYVAGALLAAAGALLGNARHPRAWPGWTEPPSLNVALVGLPSAGKSPAMGVILSVVAGVEAELNADFEARKREAATAKQEAAERLAIWETEVKTAVKSGSPVPDQPAGAVAPPAAQRRRAYSTDPTIAKAARLSQANPRGMLLFRDELSGWFGGMAGKEHGPDRAFWLQAWNGSAWTPDRVKDGDDEVTVRHLTWAIVGGIQPDKVASLMLAGDDDGLSARFLPIWPDPVKPTRPTGTANEVWATAALMKLRSIAWEGPDRGVTPLSEGAANILQDWRNKVAAREAAETGHYLSWLGKLPGFALRLSAILQHLAWCTDARNPEPPDSIGDLAMLHAVTFLDSYAVPMARRTFGEAARPKPERDAQHLARWLLRCDPMPELLNARELRRMAGGPGLADAETTEAALAELAEAGWVRSAPTRAGGGFGRARSDWQVNPAIHNRQRTTS